jgi:hypothetical protein
MPIRFGPWFFVHTEVPLARATAVTSEFRLPSDRGSAQRTHTHTHVLHMLGVRWLVAVASKSGVTNTAVCRSTSAMHIPSRGPSQPGDQSLATKLDATGGFVA